MKWKGCEKKRSCRYLTYSPGSCLKELAKNTVNFRLAFPPLPPGQGESHGPPLCQTLVIFFRSYRHTNPVNHKLHVLYLLTLILLSGEYGEPLIMPANGRWDLIRGLKG